MFTERGSFLCIRDERSLPVAHGAIEMQNQVGIPTSFI